MMKIAHWDQEAKREGRSKQSDAECEETFDEISLPQIDMRIKGQRGGFKPGNSLPLPRKLGRFPCQRRSSAAEITHFHCPSPLTSAPSCRICLDSNPTDQLISPCLCRGSQGYVHLSCLQEWIVRTVDTGIAYCELCRHAYHLKYRYKTQLRCCNKKEGMRIWQPLMLLIASAVLLCVLILSWQEGFVEKPLLVAFGFIGSCSTLLFLLLTFSRVLAMCLLRKVILVPSPN